MEAKEAIWKKCLEKIEESILPDSFTTWFSPTYPRNLDNGLITIAVPNQFYRKCLIENYRELIETTLKSISEEPLLVDFCVDSKKIPQKKLNRPETTLTEETINTLSIEEPQNCSKTLNKNYTFILRIISFNDILFFILKFNMSLYKFSKVYFLFRSR